MFFTMLTKLNQVEKDKPNAGKCDNYVKESEKMYYTKIIYQGIGYFLLVYLISRTERKQEEA